MRKLIICILCFLLCKDGQGQLADSLRNHIDTALSILEDHSLYAFGINWKKAKRNAYANAKSARNKQDLFEVIANVYKRLNDSHGRFEHFNNSLSVPDSTLLRRQSGALVKEWAKGPKIKTAMIGKAAYLRMPGMHAFNKKQVEFYTNWFADSLVSLSNRNPSAWIIDLRLNNGGNIRPMMAVLAAFFEDGIISGYLDKHHRPVSISSIHNRMFYMDDTLQVKLTKTLPDLTKAKVAVITGAGTASSGEAVAAVFKERKGTKLFGEKTAGLANSTEGFVFGNDNAYFLISTSMLGNKKLKALPRQVSPHFFIKNNHEFDEMEKDNAVSAGLRWLKIP